MKAAAALAFAGLLLAGCGPFSDSDGVKFSSAEYGVTASPRVTRGMRIEKGGGRYQVGEPYQVAGRWYTPAYDPDYQATGKASWYGPNFHGRLTANGEVFDRNGISGAHPTLPLPSYVRVTNLDNGRSLTVRVNDRGPYTRGRVVDVSERAAEMLGFKTAGTANVRVEYVGAAPLEGDDTRALIATYDAGGGVLSGTGPEVPVPPRQQRLFGRLFDGSLFSYADEGDAAIDGAFAAADAMAAGQLTEWQQSVDMAARELDVILGTFTDPGEARDIAIAFARLGAVTLEPEDTAGPSATAVWLTTLKPGVTRADVLNLAREIGLGDIVLY